MFDRASIQFTKSWCRGITQSSVGRLLICIVHHCLKIYRMWTDIVKGVKPREIHLTAKETHILLILVYCINWGLNTNLNMEGINDV